MPRDEYRIEQGPIRRALNETGVRAALAAVHRKIEARVRRRREQSARHKRWDRIALISLIAAAIVFAIALTIYLFGLPDIVRNLLAR
jgi:hypothetical protein